MLPFSPLRHLRCLLWGDVLQATERGVSNRYEEYTDVVLKRSPVASVGHTASLVVLLQ
jgi:hypothetical protein